MGGENGSDAFGAIGGSIPTNGDAGTAPFDHDPSEDDDVTDPEGWIYGDNKWEGGSGKGGMGKASLYILFFILTFWY